MINDSKLALFLMLGQSAERIRRSLLDVAPTEALEVSRSLDLAEVIPSDVQRANAAAVAYRLIFVFENYLREMVRKVLQESGADSWKSLVPKDVQDEVLSQKTNEETKSWMALENRDDFSLLTYPQLLKIIDSAWKTTFEEVVRDKQLIHQARMVTHLRNTICHMAIIPDEEVERVRQVMRDWFRMVAP
jgi:hypothetical protein